MRTKNVLAVLLCFLLVLSAGSVVSAQEEVPEDRLKKKFFESLKRPQVVSLLETLDNARQLTDFELGAKYRWGYIPPDRRPPVSLARWWRSKSQRQKNDLRAEWFDKHYEQLELDRSARELGLMDRVTRMHRELRSELANKPGKLEPVTFPGKDTPDPTMSSSGDTSYKPVYRQRPESVGTSSDGDASSAPGESESSDPAQAMDATESSDSEPSEETDEKEDGENLRYRRVGNKVVVVSGEREEDTGSDRERMDETDADTRPDQPRETSEPTGERPARDGSTSSPNLQLDNRKDTNSTTRLPEPILRNGRSNKGPALRRSNENS